MSSPDETATKTDDSAPAGWAGSVPALRTGIALLATFAIGLAGGYAAKLLHFPLPYMTGALLTTAALGLAGAPVRSVWQARAAGQLVAGTAVSDGGGDAIDPEETSATVGRNRFIAPQRLCRSRIILQHLSRGKRSVARRRLPPELALPGGCCALRAGGSHRWKLGEAAQ